MLIYYYIFYLRPLSKNKIKLQVPHANFKKWMSKYTDFDEILIRFVQLL